MLKEMAAFCDKANEETKPRNGVVDINKEKQERCSIKWKGAKTEETISCNLNYNMFLHVRLTQSSLLACTRVVIILDILVTVAQ